MTSWENFGSFISDLNKGRDELPVEMKQTVANLIKGIDTKEEKVAILYQYLQKNTRYVSVQLGIGGWQTFDAKYVASKMDGSFCEKW